MSSEEEKNAATTMEVDDTSKPENVNPSASGEGTSKYPDMTLAQSIHQLTMMAGSESQLLEGSDIDVEALSKKVKTQVVEELENPSLYQHLQSTLGWTTDDISLTEMKKKHEEAVKSLEQKVEDAKENAGDMEVLDARFEIARYAAKSLYKDEALKAYEKVLELPKLSSGKKMDALMESARVASFYGDLKKSLELIAKAQKLADDGGDWDRRNRLKVYSALNNLLIRDVKMAASLLIGCIATFSCTELCSYEDFIVYTILSNILYLPRTEIKDKIIDGPEILSIAANIPVVHKLVQSLYDCDYKSYLHAMVEVHPILMSDRFLQPHAGYLMRELHVLGYKQFLDSYKSVTMKSMAASFGISVQYLDLQLSRFIAAGRLSAKIDKFGGVVETNRPDLKNAQYKEMIQKGDLLLNRIQKLGRVVDL
jgi:26S proteasome regulatory subunit N7